MVCFVLALCCLCSCGPKLPVYTIKPQDIPALTSDAQQQIPFRVGFFIDSQFEELTYTGMMYERSLFTGPKGPVVDVEVRAAFEQAARRMFKEVVPITATETVPDWRAKNLNVVVAVGDIECTVEGQGAKERWPPVRPLLFATICAEWTILDPYGKPVTSMIVVGQGQARPSGGYKPQREAIVKALDAHFVKAYDNIVMTAWWRDSSWKSN